jgi:hypothetical protein
MVTVPGIFNVATGAFVTTGPGKLAGAAGTLVLEGVEDLAALSFVEDVTGVV